MNDSEHQERVRKLKEVNTIIKLLEPEIRASAFELLKPYIGTVVKSGTNHKEVKSDSGKQGAPVSEEFFTKFDHSKPADNAKLIAAYHFSQYGSAAISLDEVREIAKQVGLTIPERLDMTFVDARKGGKSLFKRAGRGSFSPTVHGEKYLKETYGVSKGTV